MATPAIREPEFTTLLKWGYRENHLDPIRKSRDSMLHFLLLVPPLPSPRMFMLDSVFPPLLLCLNSFSPSPPALCSRLNYCSVSFSLGLCPLPRFLHSLSLSLLLLLCVRKRFIIRSSWCVTRLIPFLLLLLFLAFAFFYPTFLAASSSRRRKLGFPIPALENCEPRQDLSRKGGSSAEVGEN